MSRLGESDFGLDAGEMENIKHQEVLKRRRRHAHSSKGKVFSENLSREAQIAMQLAREDTLQEIKALEEANAKGVQSGDSGYSKSDCVSVKTASTGSRKSVAGSVSDLVKDDGDKTLMYTSSVTPSSFTEIYRRTQPTRMTKDITDVSYKPEDDVKRALGGGKVESAMEIIEVVNHNVLEMDTDCTAVDEAAILELARINSTEKCAVWMEATAGHQGKGLAGHPDDPDQLTAL